MIVQSDTYYSVPEAVSNLVLSKVSPLDEYIIMCVDRNHFSALVRTPLGQVNQYDVFAVSSGRSYYWDVSERNYVSWEYQVKNEYYVVSNIGYGTELVPPSVSYMTSWATSGMVCLAFLLCVIPYLWRRLFRK